MIARDRCQVQHHIVRVIAAKATDFRQPDFQLASINLGVKKDWGGVGAHAETPYCVTNRRVFCRSVEPAFMGAWLVGEGGGSKSVMLDEGRKFMIRAKFLIAPLAVLAG